MAAWKMEGLVVTPTTFFSSMSLRRVPVSRRPRERSSSQMETPASDSCWVGVVISVSPKRWGLALKAGEGVLGGGGHCFCRDAELLEKALVVGGSAVVLEADGTAGVADEFPPAQGQAGFHRDACLDGGRQDGFAVGGILLLEPLDARHGNDAGGDAVGLQRFAGLDGQLDLGTGGNEDHVGRYRGAVFRSLGQDVAALRNTGGGPEGVALGVARTAFPRGDVLAGQDDACRVGVVFQHGLPGGGNFV